MQAHFPKPGPDRVRYTRSQNKTSGNASITNRGMFFVLAIDAEKFCQLCKQEMRSNAGYSECDNNHVISSHHILAEKIYYVTGKVQGS